MYLDTHEGFSYDKQPAYHKIAKEQICLEDMAKSR